MALTESQQHLLSYLKLVHVSSYEQAILVYKEILNKEINVQYFADELLLLNNVIKKYDFEIVECFDEMSSEKLLIFINTVSDEITLKAKFMNKNATQYFAEIIKDCIISDKGSITETRCLNLCVDVGLTKTAAQVMMDAFIKEKWLVCKDGNISLGMRTIMENEQSIRQCYVDIIKNCLLCKKIIILGYNCENCNVKYHHACLKKYVSSISKTQCLKCNQEWATLPVNINKNYDISWDRNNSQTTISNPIPKRRKAH